MTDTDTRMTEAYELGCHRGWEHANFVNAYGKEHERRGPDIPARYLPIAHQSDEYYRYTKEERMAEMEIRPRLAAEFKRGWTDGRRRFHRDQYPDGTKIDD